MQARVSPTSPAAKHKKAEAVSAVWDGAELQQPPRTPWGKIWLLIILVTLIANLGVTLGLGWYVHQRPNTWLTKFVPLTSSTTTTVVQQLPSRDQRTIPTDVDAQRALAYGLARNQGQGGIYTAGNVTGFAWPLSTTGWLLTVNGSSPIDAKSVAVLPAAGASQPVINTVTDPSSAFIFLKTSDLHVSPIAFAPTSELQPGQTVWVMNGDAAFSRQLNQRLVPVWASSDQLEATWTLDTSVDVPVGSAVVDANGRLLGLLGNQNRMWPVTSLSEALKTVLTTSALDRPVLGIRTLDRSTALTSGQTALSGLLIGAADGQTAVVAKSPADKAGLKSGDVITAINGQSVSGDLATFLSTYHPGDVLKLTFQRLGKEQTVSVTLGSTRT